MTMALDFTIFDDGSIPVKEGWTERKFDYGLA
jgi:hypothetical protein